jgi:hypothetical protein
MQVGQVTHDINDDGEVGSETVKLRAVYSDDPESENAQWSRWTPSAQFEIHINNPQAFGKLTKNHEFFVDFTPASD